MQDCDSPLSVIPRAPRVMRFIPFLSLLITLLPSSSIRAQARPTKYALLIGLTNSHTLDAHLDTLTYAEDDATQLAAALKAQDYTVTLLTDSTADRTRIIKELVWHAMNLREDDDFILFYSGHGVRNSLVNHSVYWLTFQASINCLDAEAIRVSHILELVREIKAHRKLILLDHCLSGEVVAQLSDAGPSPLAPEVKPKGIRQGDVLARLDKSVTFDLTELQDKAMVQGTVVISAARREALEVASLKHGVFTSALLSALTTRDAATARGSTLSLAALVTHLKTTVKALLKDIKDCSQTVDSYGGDGLNIDEWIVAAKLPKGTIQELTTATTGYRKLLAQWHGKELLEDDAWILCLAAIDAVVEAASSRQEIAGEHARIYKAIQSCAESKASEKTRAHALTDALVEISHR